MTRADVEAAIRDALARINRPAPDFRFDTVPFGDATPHVEGDGPVFDWVISERGRELERRTLSGPDLIYTALESMTRQIAISLELGTRQGDYSRATWMDAHRRIMAHLNPEWGARVGRTYADLLQGAPLTGEDLQHARRLDLSDLGLPDPN